jgi:hypothetical protein
MIDASGHEFSIKGGDFAGPPLDDREIDEGLRFKIYGRQSLNTPSCIRLSYAGICSSDLCIDQLSSFSLRLIELLRRQDLEKDKQHSFPPM